MGTGLRWENNFIRCGKNFAIFWNDYLLNSERNILFIMGIGFDPRTNHGIKEVFSIKSKGKRECIAIRYKKYEKDDNNSSNTFVIKHIEELEQFLNETLGVKPNYKYLVTRSDEDKSIGSVNASKLIGEGEIHDFSDIIIDISAMPRGVFLPLINKILYIIDKQDGRKKNLHVIVAENPELDSSIKDKGVEEQMTYPHGFRISDTIKTKEYSKIWIPILGEGQLEQFKIIDKELEPVAICPVLPFPSSNLRRGDNLINYYQDYLFNDSDFEPNNIIYADEQNPFQVYRLLNRTIEQYHDTFRILGGCKFVISTHSSKLLTVGAFLSVYEAKAQGKIVGIAHVESIDYNLNADERDAFSETDKLYEIWIAGEPYEE
jgi:hypothetical protein